MKYTSTRSYCPTDSLKAVLNSIAPDGGLYISKDILNMSFDWKQCLKLNTPDMSKMICKALLDDFDNIESIIEKSYKDRFETKELTPLVKVGKNYVCELFHGPTCAFKDVALSVLPNLIVSARKKAGFENDTIILTATSGDTGKAALEAFKDVTGTKIIVFYPKEGVSEIQKRQMITQKGSNVKVCAVDGNFDDCQSAVKQAFNSIKDKGLASANSINIGRLIPQIVYYFSSYRDLLKTGEISQGEKINFAVPTGNFGDILAGYYAKLMGLPIDKLICASNSNNVLTDFLKTGTYNRNRPFFKTISPSMDILISSNLERLLFLLSDGNFNFVSNCMTELGTNGRYSVPQAILAKIQESFLFGSATEEETQDSIRQCYYQNNYLLDPHTAVAWNVTQKLNSGKTVVLSTASPFKFSTSVSKALDLSCQGSEFELMKALSLKTSIAIPKSLSELENLPVLHNDCISKDRIVEYVRKELDLWI